MSLFLSPLASLARGIEVTTMALGTAATIVACTGDTPHAVVPHAGPSPAASASSAVVAPAAPSSGESTSPLPTPEATARALVRHLVALRFDDVIRVFDGAMTAAMPADKLREAWTGVVQSLGAFKEIKAVAEAESNGLHVVVATCAFANREANIRVVVDGGGKVVGFAIRPVEIRWDPPAYADASKFREESVSVGADPLKLPARLTLPNVDTSKAKGVRASPAVVLVHGSGPADADDTIGANKPFRDLAFGLGSRGIAVLRYVKRTAQHPAAFSKKPYTVLEETVDDARLAVAYLTTRPEVDSKHIYIIGHSLGGMLAPRIADGAKNIAGIVMLAGATRPLEELMLEQIKYGISLPGVPEADAKAALAAAEATVAAIRNPKLVASDEVDFLGAPTPGSYWLDLRAYRSDVAASRLNLPMCILQGGRDYQVGRADYDLWAKAVGKRPNVKMKLYPSLNHFFFDGSGPSVPSEYEVRTHVYQQVIDDIAAWVTSGGKGLAKP